jgi:penicillin amidase
MDLLRRSAAGELAALVGAKALPIDQSRRIHRFRYRADLALAALPAEQRALLDAYTAGVNEGLTALAVRPFEYGLLRQAPKPWQAADSFLVVLSMYLDLQGSQGRDDLAMGVLKSAVEPDWYAFLTQHSADWQAAIDGSVVTAVPVPATPWPDALANAAKDACIDCS